MMELINGPILKNVRGKSPRSRPERLTFRRHPSERTKDARKLTDLPGFCKGRIGRFPEKAGRRADSRGMIRSVIV